MRTLNDVMAEIDDVVYGPDVLPYSGWHDDHRQYDGTPLYLPALQQVRSEFERLAKTISMCGLAGGRCLQLGLGPSKASHPVWGRVFAHVVTIDLSICIDDAAIQSGLNTHSYEATRFADNRKGDGYDFLFIDAGHSLQDVASDYYTYSPMVRTGGMIAFHDALPRAEYPEIEVHKFIKTLPVTVFGDEVGTAVMEAK